MVRPGGAGRAPSREYGVGMLFEWIADNPWAAWLVIAGVLAVSEMATLDMTLLMLSLGAVAGIAVAIVLPGVIWAQVLVAVAVALLCLTLVRPSILKRLHRGTGFRSSVDNVVGATGTTVREVTATGGEVKVNGESWTARSYDGEPIAAGVPVDVFEIDGVTLLVHPTHKPLQ